MVRATRYNRLAMDRDSKYLDSRILWMKNDPYCNGPGWQRPEPWAEQEIGLGVARCPVRLAKEAQPA